MTPPNNSGRGCKNIRRSHDGDYFELALPRQKGSELVETGLAVWLPGGIGAGVSFDEALILLFALIAVTT
jgi:hypothetical protein